MSTKKTQKSKKKKALNKGQFQVTNQTLNLEDVVADLSVTAHSLAKLFPKKYGKALEKALFMYVPGLSPSKKEFQKYSQEQKNIIACFDAAFNLRILALQGMAAFTDAELEKLIELEKKS